MKTQDHASALAMVEFVCDSEEFGGQKDYAMPVVPIKGDIVRSMSKDFVVTKRTFKVDSGGFLGVFVEVEPVE